MDYGELLFRTAALVTNVSNLLDDIDVDVADRQRRDALLMEGDTIRAEMNRLAGQSGRAPPTMKSFPGIGGPPSYGGCLRGRHVRWRARAWPGASSV